MIHRLSPLIAALVLSACTSIVTPPPATGDTVQVMVLGTYHFANPGLDLVNSKADDVLAPRRQAELQALADRLAAFRPTAIAVESTHRDTNLLDMKFAEFKPGDLDTERNETVQIAYRLASQLGIERVYAIDENEGEIEFFPFDRVQATAERTGQTGQIDALLAGIQADAAAFDTAQETETIPMLLARYNDPDRIRAEHDSFYYGLLSISDEADAAGAALNYGWYARNALIFSHIVHVAEPGDRILVLYGAGHNYWLRHFAEETPGFELVEPVPYLTGQAENGS